MPEEFRLIAVGYDHPDAARLTEEVQHYYAGLYGAPDASPVDPDEFAAPDGGFLVGYLGAEPVAMGGWRFTSVEVPGARRPVELKRMFVRPGHRRRGLAARTLRALEADAAHAGADYFILETGRPQADALDFYRAQGYTDIDRFGFYAAWPNSVSLGRRLSGGHLA